MNSHRLSESPTNQQKIIRKVVRNQQKDSQKIVRIGVNCLILFLFTSYSAFQLQGQNQTNKNITEFLHLFFLFSKRVLFYQLLSLTQKGPKPIAGGFFET